MEWRKRRGGREMEEVVRGVGSHSSKQEERGRARGRESEACKQGSEASWAASAREAEERGAGQPAIVRRGSKLAWRANWRRRCVRLRREPRCASEARVGEKEEVAAWNKLGVRSCCTQQQGGALAAAGRAGAGWRWRVKERKEAAVQGGWTEKGASCSAKVAAGRKGSRDAAHGGNSGGEGGAARWAAKEEVLQ